LTVLEHLYWEKKMQILKKVLLICLGLMMLHLQAEDIVGTGQSIERLKLQISKNNPRLGTDYIDKLANVFYNVGQKYNIPANILAAIASVESNYKLGAINGRSGDFGIMQINLRAHRKFDKEKLLTDLQYSVEAGAQVFLWFFKRYTLETAIKRYNCGTKRTCIRWSPVIKYLDKIRRAW